MFTNFQMVVESIIEKHDDKARMIFSNIYGIIHLGLGFFILWMAYFYLQTLFADDLETNLLGKSALEVVFLVIGVLWGNIGWDRMAVLKKENGYKKFGYYIVLETAPLLFIAPLLMILIGYIHDAFEYGWEMAGYLFPVPLAWVGLGLLVLIIGSFQRRV